MQRGTIQLGELNQTRALVNCKNTYAHLGVHTQFCSLQCEKLVMEFLAHTSQLPIKAETQHNLHFQDQQDPGLLAVPGW
jgi:hypothetical protein